MKRLLRNIAFVAVAAAGAVSCAETDINDNIDINRGKLVLTAITPSGEPSTKVDFTDNGTEGIALEWSDGDSFTLYNSADQKVDTFTKAEGENQFSSSIDGLTLNEGEVYTAKYREDADPAIQDGDAIASLDNACQMEATFTYSPEAEVVFLHKMAIMTFQFESKARPAKLVFENGDEVYTVNYSTIEPNASNLYISHIMINPCDEGARDLKFSLYAEGAEDPYDVREVATDRAYVAGCRYTSPVSNLDPTIQVGTGTAEDPFQIATAAQLIELSANVAGGNTYEGKFLEVVKDIDLGGVEFAPIGKDYNNTFMGSFNGAGHTISGLFINSENDFQGLFGYISKATIKNVNVSGNVTGCEIVGGLVGYAGESSIISCNNSVAVTGTSYRVGGIVAEAYASTIAFCSNSGTIKAGYYQSIDKESNVGGIMGNSRGNTYIISCYNTGDVTGEAYYVGGIAGNTAASIIACYNSGNIKTDIAYDGYASGIAGYVGNLDVVSCYNVGTVKCGDKLGYILGKISNDLKINTVYSLESTCSRGIGNTNYSSVQGAVQLISEDELKSDDLLTLLNNASYTYNEESSIATKACAWVKGNDGYPVLDPKKLPEYINIESDLVYNESTDTYEIRTAKALREFAAKVNAGEMPIKGLLTSDIDLEDAEFKPMGSKDVPFSGSFDGDGHSISGLYINSEESYQGLFGSIKEATIQNVNVSGSVSGKGYIGGLTGYARESSIISCGSSVAVTGTSYRVGGISGYCYETTIALCHNSGVINGGVDLDQGYTGGITGSSNYPIVSCYNTGDVTGAGEYVGGIIGRTTNSVISCYNRGDIKSGLEYVGGIIGEIHNNEDDYIDINACYNTGNISCGTSWDTYAGSIVGNTDDKVQISDAYYLENTCKRGIGGNSHADLIGTAKLKSETELKAIDMLVALNNASYTYNTNNPDAAVRACAWVAGTDGYPAFDPTKLPELIKIDSNLIYNEETDTYEISSASALREFAKKVNEDNNNRIKGLLTYDIDLEGVEFTPIGAKVTPSTPVAKFMGSFDGAGHTISGLNINSTSSYQGLFGYISEATIKNVNVSGSVTGKESVGGLVGYAYNSSITSCSSSVTVTSTFRSVGGIAGDIKNTAITSCYNSGTITNTSSSASYGGSCTGGIVGKSLHSEASIISCYNTGDVSVTGGSKEYTGGIVGFLYSFNGAYGANIIACYNSGNIKGGNYVAGIVGNYCTGTKSNNIEMCYNVGNIEGTSNCGAFLGYNKGKTNVSNLYYEENTCANAIGGQDTTDYTQPIGAIDSSSAADIQSDDFVRALNIAAAEYNTANPDAIQLCGWKLISGENGGYPVLDYNNLPVVND